MFQVSLRQLKSFLAVCKHGSFQGAAGELHLTPPAVSMQIKQLEDELELLLFDRTHKHVVLTQAGETLFGYAKTIQEQLREADQALAALKGVEGGRLVIGMVSTAKYFIPSILASFKKQYSLVEISLFEGNRDQLLEKLVAGELDLGVMGRPPSENDMISQRFAANPHGIVASTDHALCKRKNIPVETFSNAPFIVREQGSGTRAAMEAFFQEHDVHPKVVMTMNSNETIKQAVMVNLGLSFISLDTARVEVGLGRLAILDVVGLPLIKHWQLVQMRHRQLPPAAEAFTRFMLTKRMSPVSLVETG